MVARRRQVSGLDFSGNMAGVQQQLAASHDMSVRRTRVLQALAAAPGEHVLDVGCGSGLMLRAIGEAVGPHGSAVGIDLSEDQVGAARSNCDDLPQVEVHVGDVVGFTLTDDYFDAVLSVQVLEYITNVEEAVVQLNRVTSTGGRFVNVATNWGALFWTGGDSDLTSRMLSIWRRHAPHPNLPIALPSLLNAAGFGAVRQSPITIVNRHFHPNTFGYGIAHLMAAFALARSEMSQDEIDSWLASLAEGDTNNRYFLSSVPILTVATRL